MTTRMYRRRFVLAALASAALPSLHAQTPAPAEDFVVNASGTIMARTLFE